MRHSAVRTLEISSGFFRFFELFAEADLAERVAAQREYPGDIHRVVV